MKPMTRLPNTFGGGARTNLNGLQFEDRTDLRQALEQHPIYQLDENDQVIKNGVVVAQYFEKHGLYKKLLQPRGVNHKTLITKRLLPDGALLVGSTLYIIEKKYQNGNGSVDEKLQTCDFKKKQYQKLLQPLCIRVEFYFVLNDWFRKDTNEDVFKYIESVGCKYFFETLPLVEVGL